MTILAAVPNSDNFLYPPYQRFRVWSLTNNKIDAFVRQLATLVNLSSVASRGYINHNFFVIEPLGFSMFCGSVCVLLDYALVNLFNAGLIHC